MEKGTAQGSYLQVTGSNWSNEAMKDCRKVRIAGWARKESLENEQEPHKSRLTTQPHLPHRTSRIHSTEVPTARNQSLTMLWHQGWLLPWVPMTLGCTCCCSCNFPGSCVYFTGFWYKVLGERLKLTDPRWRWHHWDSNIGHSRLQSSSLEDQPATFYRQDIIMKIPKFGGEAEASTGL